MLMETPSSGIAPQLSMIATASADGRSVSYGCGLPFVFFFGGVASGRASGFISGSGARFQNPESPAANSLDTCDNSGLTTYMLLSVLANASRAICFKRSALSPAVSSREL